MRALAEFIMRGRLRAAVVALIGNWVPLLTPATVALVTLRAGWQNGLLILLWGVLPAALMLGFSQIDPLVPVVVVSGVGLAYALALVLRHSASWAHCLMGAAAVSTLVGLALQALSPQIVEVVTDNVSRMIEQLQADEGQAPVESLGVTFSVGLIAYFVAFTGMLGLVVGRWWQALVYNPGGFGAEFQAIRLNRPQAILCLLAGLYSLFQGADYAIWFSVFTMPLLFTGLAIAHRIVAVKQWGVQWLVLFYATLVFLDPVTQLLIVLAFLDTWLNFRGRVKPKV